MQTIYDFLLENAKETKMRDWREFESKKTMFGTEVDVNRTDVLVGMLIKDDPLPPVSAVQKEGPKFLTPDQLGDKEIMPSATLSITLIIPEEFHRYELDRFTRKHAPIFKLKE